MTKHEPSRAGNKPRLPEKPEPKDPALETGARDLGSAIVRELFGERG